MSSKGSTRRIRRSGCLLWIVGLIAVVAIVSQFAGDRDSGDRRGQVTPVPTFTPTAVIARSAPVIEIPTGMPELPTVTPLSPTAPVDTPVPAIPTEPPTPVPVPTLCDCSADLYNCDDFGWSRVKGDEAQACYRHCMDTIGVDIHRLDRDQDGGACEWEQ